ncbi:MAG: hypothetical protein ACFFCS_02895 [Candidatus Hodarchaeota archaeon]
MADKKNFVGIIALGLSVLGVFYKPHILSPIAIIAGIVGIILVKNDVAGTIGVVVGFFMVNAIYLGWFQPNELNVVYAVIGYSFSIANEMIGISHIKDVQAMKQQLGFVKAHKIYGRMETMFFFSISIICVCMPLRMYLLLGDPPIEWLTDQQSVFNHAALGGFLALFLFLIKVIPAFLMKNSIYKHGMILGPMGFLAWTLGYFTSIINYYGQGGIIGMLGEVPRIWPNIWWNLVTAILVGIILFLYAKSYNQSVTRTPLSPTTHGVALILHGISFGYESAAKELVGAPVLFKYVYPYTYKSLDRLAVFLGVDLEELKKMELNDALDYYMKKCADIGMAEKIKIKWSSEDTFTIESVNCSTAIVRSKIPAEEIKGTICPWALLAASLVNQITGRELEIGESEYYDIGSKTVVKVKEPTK